MVQKTADHRSAVLFLAADSKPPAIFHDGASVLQHNIDIRSGYITR
jgi:hypothetical protein